MPVSIAPAITPNAAAQASWTSGVNALTEPLLERPQQGLADEVEMLRHDAVADVAGAESDQERRDLLDVVEPVDGGLDRRHRPARLQRDVVAEQRRVPRVPA